MSLWQIVGVSVTISDTGDLRSRDLLLIPIYQPVKSIDQVNPFGVVPMTSRNTALVTKFSFLLRQVLKDTVYRINILKSSAAFTSYDKITKQNYSSKRFLRRLFFNIRKLLKTQYQIALKLWLNQNERILIPYLVCA